MQPKCLRGLKERNDGQILNYINVLFIPVSIFSSCFPITSISISISIVIFTLITDNQQLLLGSVRPDACLSFVVAFDQKQPPHIPNNTCALKKALKLIFVPLFPLRSKLIHLTTCNFDRKDKVSFFQHAIAGL